MNTNILKQIDKALLQAEPSTSPTTDSVVGALTRSRKIFQPEVMRNKRFADYDVEKTVAVILKGKPAGTEKSFTQLRELQTQFEDVFKQFPNVSTTAATAKHRKQNTDARQEVASTGRVPEDFEIKSADSIHETFRTARGALMERATKITEQAAILASPIRATAMKLIADDAKTMEANERAQAAAYGISFEPSELLRVHWAILIRNSGPLVKPGSVMSPRAMLAGIVNL